MKYVRVSKVEEMEGFPFKKSTHYKWHHCKKYPEIFLQLGRSLFIDIEKFWKLIESHRLTDSASEEH